MNRTHTNGELDLVNLNEEVVLIGWVAKKRNFGSLVFIDLRDRTGITQLVLDETLLDTANTIRNEYIIEVKGIVVERKDKNDKLSTGDIEVKVSDLKIINTANTTPLIIADETDALEDTRMKYRYLDLRRPIMQQKLIERAAISRTMRRFLEDNGFIEIETPIFLKSTPEGARDYLVPSRVHPGSFYALPQSPQMLKQLLMISGFERYYQVAKCFRDEDLRADRQPEFTQVDIEASFLGEEEIRALMEEMLRKVMREVKGIEIKTPFKTMSYNDAMSIYGSDKPDTRYEMTLNDITEIFSNSEFKVFKETIENNGCIKAIVVDGQASLSRKEIDNLTDIAKKNKAKGLVTLKYVDNELQGSIVKFLNESEIATLVSKLSLKDNDLVLIASDEWEVVCNVLGTLRCHFAKVLNLADPFTYEFLWVVDFPLFEYSKEDGRYYAKHHPFTRPKESDLQYLQTDPSKVNACAYDIVLNGYEIGGGSLRIYDQELQQTMFNTLGFSKDEINNRFGYFVDAFQYGTPPHGGIAFGLDRVAMILTQSESIREVIAFPKNANAKCPMSDAPGVVDNEQLEELHIKIK